MRERNANIMNIEKIKEVFSDEEYVKALFAMKSYEEAQKSLAEKDIDVSVEELRRVRKLLIKKANGELTDEELAEAAGGFWSFIVAGGILFGGCVTGIGIMLKDDYGRC